MARDSSKPSAESPDSASGTHSAVDALLELAKAGETGEVEITTTEQRYRVSVQSSQIRNARSSEAESRLGHLLVEEELLTSNQLQAAVSLAETTRRPIGLTLIELGFASPLEVRETLARQVSRVLRGLVDVPDCQADFRPCDFADEPIFAIPIRRALFETLRRYAPDDAFDQFGGLECRLEPRYNARALLEIGLDNDEFALASLADGRRRLEELLNTGRLSTDRSLRVLSALQRLGLLEAHSPPNIRLAPEERLQSSGWPSKGSTGVPGLQLLHGDAADAEEEKSTFDLAMTAYLERDFDSALRLFRRCQEEGLSDPRIMHNIRVIKQRHAAHRSPGSDRESGRR